MSEEIGKLMVSIGADIGQLTKSFAQTAKQIGDIKQKVSEVNFDNLVKNAQVSARVIKSLRTQTVNGFADVVASVKNVGVAISQANKGFSLMGANAQKTTQILNKLPFNKILQELTQINKNTSGVTAGFKNMAGAVELNGKTLRRHEFDLHRVILRLDALNRKMAGVQKGFGVNSSIRSVDAAYLRLGRSMQYAGSRGNKSSNQIAAGVGLISASMLTGSRIMRAFSHNFIDGMALMSAEFWVLGMAAQTAYRILMYFPKKAIQSVDAYRLSMIKTQALISTFSKKDIDFGVSFQNASQYAKQLVSEMDILAAYTMGTSFDLQAITQEFMKQGVLLDINNDKSKEAFLNIANAIEIIASGFQAAELQIRQEARALAMGQVDLRATLATELNARLGGQLKENIELWKQEGTFIVHIGDLLQGYAASLKDIRATWKSNSALFKTMTDRIIRFSSEEFYTAVNTQLRKMNDYLQKNENLISGKVYLGWKAVLEIVSSVKKAYEILKEPIQKLIDLASPFLQSWGTIFLGYIPESIERIALGLKGIVDIITLIIKTSDYAMSGGGLMDKFLGYKSEESQKALKEIKDLYNQINKNKAFNLNDLGSPLGIGLGEDFFKDVRARITQVNSDYYAFLNSLKKTSVETPKIIPQIDRDQFNEEYNSFLSSTSAKTERWLNDEMRQIDKHRNDLIRNNKLIIQDMADIEKHALSLNISGWFTKPSTEPSPNLMPKEIGTYVTQWLYEYVKIVTEADKKTQEFTKDINAMSQVQKWEKEAEKRKTIEAPGLAMSQRWGSPLEKEQADLKEFIRERKRQIKELETLGLISSKAAGGLYGKLNKGAFDERRRIIEESNQKIEEEMSKFNAFIAERTGGKDSLTGRIADEKKDLEAALNGLLKLYDQKNREGLISEKQYSDKRAEMEKASGNRILFIKEEFLNEMKSKELSFKKSQLDVAEIQLTLGRGDVARQRLVLSQQELELEVKHLDTLSRIQGEGSLAWSEQKSKVEELRAEIAALGQTVAETTGTFGEGIKYGINKFVRDSSSAFEYGVQFINEAASGMSSFISGVFSDLRNGEVKSWQEYATQVIDVFASIAEKILAEMIVTQALKSLGISRNTTDTQGVVTTSALTVAFAAQIPVIELLTAAYWALAIAKMAAGVGGGAGGISGASSLGTSGASTMGTASAGYGGILVHEGGYIPRFHKGGLSSDEVFAILQKGEYVINRNSVKKIGKGNLDHLNQKGLSKGLQRISGEDFSGGSTTVNQNIHFNIEQPMDAYTFDSYLKRNHGTIKRIVGQGINQSVGFKKQMRGK